MPDRDDDDHDASKEAGEPEGQPDPRSLDESLRLRLEGRLPTGTVKLRDFDEGMVLGIGGIVLPDRVTKQPKYFAQIKGVADEQNPYNGMPGVPIAFGTPDPAMQSIVYPYISIQRDDISPAMERWQPSGVQYRAPAPGALPTQTTLPNGQVVFGYAEMQEQAQAMPYDLMYTIEVVAKQRGAPEQRNAVNLLFAHALRRFPPYGWIYVKDSVGDWRTYEAFNESISNLDDVGDASDRHLAFVLTVRVEAELDLQDPVEIQTVKRPLTLKLTRL